MSASLAFHLQSEKFFLGQVIGLMGPSGPGKTTLLSTSLKIMAARSRLRDISPFQKFNPHGTRGYRTRT